MQLNSKVSATGLASHVSWFTTLCSEFDLLKQPPLCTDQYWKRLTWFIMTNFHLTSCQHIRLFCSSWYDDTERDILFVSMHSSNIVHYFIFWLSLKLLRIKIPLIPCRNGFLYKIISTATPFACWPNHVPSCLHSRSLCLQGNDGQMRSVWPTVLCQGLALVDIQTYSPDEPKLLYSKTTEFSNSISSTMLWSAQCSDRRHSHSYKSQAKCKYNMYHHGCLERNFLWSFIASWLRFHFVCNFDNTNLDAG